MADHFGFDPNSVFGGLEPDYEALARRDAAEIARRDAETQRLAQERVEKERQRAEAEREHLEALARREEAKAQMQRALYAANERRRAKEAEAEARFREESARRYPELKPLLEEEEVRRNGAPAVSWPPTATEDVEGLEAPQDAEDPFPPYTPDPDDSDFDAFCVGSIHAQLIRARGTPKLDRTIIDEAPHHAPATDVQEEDKYECERLLYAIRDLYEFRPSVRNNMTNPLTRRLRTYYQYIVWREYGFLLPHNLDDAWATLLRVALGLRVSPTDKGIAAYQELVVYGLGRRLPAKRIRPATEALFHTLRDRAWQCRAWYRTSSGLSELAIPREITETLIRNVCGAYFIEHPDEPSVCFLRQLVYGPCGPVPKNFYALWLQMLEKLPPYLPKWPEKRAAMAFVEETHPEQYAFYFDRLRR
jgi:hypothetical protein